MTRKEITKIRKRAKMWGNGARLDVLDLCDALDALLDDRDVMTTERGRPSGQIKKDWRGLPIPPGETCGSMIRVWTIETTPDHHEDFNVWVCRSYHRAMEAAKWLVEQLMDSNGPEDGSEVEITIRIKTEMMMLEDVPEGGG